MTRTNAAQKVVRDAEIVKDRARGYTWPTIAARHRVAERHARRVFTEYLAGQLPQHESDPEALADEMLARFESVIEDLALIADGSAHDAVRLGALRSKLAALNEALAFQQRVGRLPGSRGLWADEIERERTIRVILAIFVRYGLPEEAEDDLIAALRPDRASTPGRLQSV